MPVTCRFVRFVRRADSTTHFGKALNVSRYLTPVQIRGKSEYASNNVAKWSSLGEPRTLGGHPHYRLSTFDVRRLSRLIITYILLLRKLFLATIELLAPYLT